MGCPRLSASLLREVTEPSGTGTRPGALRWCHLAQVVPLEEVNGLDAQISIGSDSFRDGRPLQELVDQLLLTEARQRLASNWPKMEDGAWKPRPQP